MAEPMSVKHDMFKIGDILVGNHPTRYTYTNDTSTVEVVNIDNERCDSIKVKILQHPSKSEIGREWWVKPQYFDFVERKEDKKMEFKVGMKVECIKGLCDVKIGMTGVVKRIHPTGIPEIGVKWNGLKDGHDLDGTLTGSEIYMGYYLSPASLIVLGEESYIEEAAKENTIVKTIVFNGNKTTVYGDENYYELDKYLYNEFEDQGDFYERVFGVSYEVADINGWHPSDNDFDESCDGWSKFINMEGVPKIKKVNAEDKYAELKKVVAEELF